MTAITRIAAPLRQQVTETLRANIVRREFAPGQRLIERNLCDRYEVSRTVVREALRALEAEGFVKIIPNVGPVVASFSAKNVRDLYETRSVLEALAGQLFAERASSEDRTRLKEQLELTVDAIESGSIQRAVVEKDRFYEILLEGGGNEIIWKDLQAINAKVNLLRGMTLGDPERAPKTVREIQEITEAVVSGDAVRAWDLCKAHVDAAKEAALKAISQLSDEGKQQ